MGGGGGGILRGWVGGGGGGSEFIKVRDISQECHQGSGNRMWEERQRYQVCRE